MNALTRAPYRPKPLLCGRCVCAKLLAPCSRYQQSIRVLGKRCGCEWSKPCFLRRGVGRILVHQVTFENRARCPPPVRNTLPLPYFRKMPQRSTSTCAMPIPGPLLAICCSHVPRHNRCDILHPTCTILSLSHHARLFCLAGTTSTRKCTRRSGSPSLSSRSF